MSMTRLAIVVASILCACEAQSPGTDPSPVKPAQPKTKTAEPKVASVAKKTPLPSKREELEAARKTYAFQLERVDKDIVGLKKITEKNKTGFALTRVASKFLERARLSGSYADYEQAENFIERAFEVKSGYGPWMVRARLNYTLHRMDRVDADLEKGLLGPAKSADAAAERIAFKANIAFQRGQYSSAKSLYEESLAKSRTLSNTSSMAMYAWKTGDFDGAEALLREALSLYHAKPTEPVAWLHLNIGLLDLDRGRYDDARAHYDEAASYIKGYWLIDEHIAEILTLQGKTEEAKALYIEIIERTENPEFMDAMAGLLLEEGKDSEAKKYVARARKRYEEQMAMYPEAAYGHALGHFLEFGDDPAFTLDLARKNYALRPNGEAATMLAEACLAAGKENEAVEPIEKVLDSPYRTADLLVAAASIFEKIGQQDRAKTLADEARTINPRILD